MECFDPVLCYTNELTNKRIFRHYTLAPDFVIDLHQQRFDCGKCLHCRKTKAYELAMRCVLHASVYQDNCFITLTYDEKKEGYHNDLQYEDIQKFKKRLRQYCKRKFNSKIEVFNVHEYGKNKKKHWHLIVFNHDFKDKTLYTRNNNIPIYTSKILEKLWPYGFNTIGDVSIASAMYQAQYMEKDFTNQNATSKFKSKSNHSGLGRSYFYSNYEQILKLGYVPFNGRKHKIPRYFEKLAHKHYAHFYEKGFFSTRLDGTKPRYRPFKPGEENIEIANLYIEYEKIKKQHVIELDKKWREKLKLIKETKCTPDFVQSGKNYTHDLMKRSFNNQKF